MCVCAYGGEWLWWSPARGWVKQKSKVGGCIRTRRVHGREARWDLWVEGCQHCETGLFLCCASWFLSYLYPYSLYLFLSGNYTSAPKYEFYLKLCFVVLAECLFGRPGSYDLRSLSGKERTPQGPLSGPPDCLDTSLILESWKIFFPIFQDKNSNFSSFLSNFSR